MSSTETSEATSVQQSSVVRRSPWERVYDAVAVRWPQIDQGELQQCEQSVDAITDFVTERVEAPREEVAAAVGEFAPERASMLEPMADNLRGFSQGVTGTVRSAVDRVQYEIDEAPVKASLGVFVLGFALGVLATTAYVRAHHEPSAWQKMRNRCA